MTLTPEQLRFLKWLADECGGGCATRYATLSSGFPEWGEWGLRGCVAINVDSRWVSLTPKGWTRADNDQ